MVNSEEAQTNGEMTVIAPQPAAKSKSIEYIDLDEDEDVILIEEEPLSKRPKLDESRETSEVRPLETKQMKSREVSEIRTSEIKPASSSPSSSAANETESKKDNGQLSNYASLLDQLQEHVDKVLKIGTGADRKLLDSLLSAINVQVQKEPYSVRKLILDKQLVLPNSISFPPSQVVDAVIEHDADMQISKVINRMFGEERLKLTDVEKRERQHFKNSFPAPSMTRLLMEVGQDLVQETTYSDIVHAKNLPEMPKNIDTYKQVAAQLKPVWENLRDKNASFKLKTYTCSVCSFKTENLLLMSVHKQTLHIGENKKIQCGMCPEYNTSGTRMHQHYVEKHGVIPLIPEEPPSKVQCPLCERDFPFKGQRDAHVKLCKRDVVRLVSIQASRMPEHSAMINRWLWSRPPADPIIQQNMRKQQTNEVQHQRSLIQIPRRSGTNIPPSKPTILKNQPMKSSQQGSANAAIGAVFATQQFQNQLKNLGPAQQQQLEQLLRLKQSEIPSNIMNSIQAQLRAIQRQQNQSQQQTAQIPSTPLAKALSQANQLNSLAKSNPELLQQLSRTLQQTQQGSHSSTSNRTSGQGTHRKVGSTMPGCAPSSSLNRSGSNLCARGGEDLVCEICDEKHSEKRNYLDHLQNVHSLLRGRNTIDLDAGPPLACSRCRDRFWSYEGLERHLVMNHNLVTSDLLQKAQNKLDGGRCRHCKKSFAFNILQHLASDHNAKLCSAEIMFSCDVCPFKCSSYTKLEAHLNESHPKNGVAAGRH